MLSWCANRKPDNERSESNDGKIQVSEVGEGGMSVSCFVGELVNINVQSLEVAPTQ